MIRARATFIEVAQIFKFGKEAAAHVAPCRFGIFQEQASQFLIEAKIGFHILFRRQLWVSHRPIVGHADKGQQAQQILISLAAEDLPQCPSLAIRATGLNE